MNIRLGDMVPCPCGNDILIDSKAGKMCPKCMTLYKPGDTMPSSIRISTAIYPMIWDQSIAEKIELLRETFLEKWGFKPTRLYLAPEFIDRLKRHSAFISGNIRKREPHTFESPTIRVTVEHKEPPLPHMFCGMEVFNSKIPGRIEVDG